jgi:hypothetical protein
MYYSGESHSGLVVVATGQTYPGLVMLEALAYQHVLCPLDSLYLAFFAMNLLVFHAVIVKGPKEGN